MDQAVITYYRRLLKSGFEYAGSIENPSIFINPTVKGKTWICGGESDYMNIYINIHEDAVEEMKYLCICDPTANVAVEAICKLMEGIQLKEALSIGEEMILGEVGSYIDELRKKVSALLELIRKELTRFQIEPSI
jgi:NifU-like protein involved in Fe-S cluster formation